jgi:hypothetical protein
MEVLSTGLAAVAVALNLVVVSILLLVMEVLVAEAVVLFGLRQAQEQHAQVEALL